MNTDKMIQAIISRDEYVMNDVINKYSRMLWSIAAPILHNVGSAEDVEECVADTFIYLWQNPHKYDAARGKITTWLSIIARTKALNRYRQLVKEDTVYLDNGLLGEQLGISQEIFSDDAPAEILSAAINALHEPEREIILRRYYYEQKPREIAIALDISVKQVGNHLYRAKLKLRRAIKK